MRKVLPLTVIASLVLLFVAINVYASQSFHPLLFKIVGPPDVGATKQFLSYIEDTPAYHQQYDHFNRMYGGVFAQEDIEAEFSLSNELDKYNALLEKSPNTPAILVKIALVHLDRRDISQAREYYARAKAIDPWVEVEELENL